MSARLSDDDDDDDGRTLALRGPLEALLTAVKAIPGDEIDPVEAREALELLAQLSAVLQAKAFGANSSSLLALPPEVLVHICRQLPVFALAAAAQTCRCFGGARVKAQAQQPIVEQALRLQEAERVPAPIERRRMHDSALTWRPCPGRVAMSPAGASELLCNALRHCFRRSQVLAAARSHSVFLSPTGRVLTCGSSSRTAPPDDDDDDDDDDEPCSAMLGQGQARTEVAKPEVVSPATSPIWPESDKRFIAVAAGPTCTLAVSDIGEVFSCGWGESLGRSASGGDEDGHILSCIGMLQRSFVVADPIVAVACGVQHCLCLSERGVVRSWGVGIEGALGHGKHGGPSERSPTTVEGLLSVRVVAVAAGFHHSVALSACGIAFSWGKAGTLGLGETAHLHSPHPIKLLLRIASADNARICAIAAGGSHSLALGHTGSAYSWGSNNEGQLGQGLDAWRLRKDEGQSPLPDRVAAPLLGSAVDDAAARVRFRAIACGASHSVALSAAGEAFAWGSSADGRLGVRLTQQGKQKGHWRRRRGRGIVLVPLRVQGPRDLVHVSAGWAHTLASTHDGRVYGWGDVSDHSLPHSLGGQVVQDQMQVDRPALAAGGEAEAPPTLYPPELRVRARESS